MLKFWYRLEETVGSQSYVTKFLLREEKCQFQMAENIAQKCQLELLTSDTGKIPIVVVVVVVVVIVIVIVLVLCPWSVSEGSSLETPVSRLRSRASSLESRVSSLEPRVSRLRSLVFIPFPFPSYSILV